MTSSALYLREGENVENVENVVDTAVNYGGGDSEIMRALDDAVSAGKVLHVGICDKVPLGGRCGVSRLARAIGGALLERRVLGLWRVGRGCG